MCRSCCSRCRAGDCLTKKQNAVADMLVRDGHPSRTDVAEVITAITHQPPLESNIDRVGKRLGEGGWLVGNDE
jgi:hypothetical protein